MSTLAVTWYPHDAGTRRLYFEKNTRDEPLTKSYEGGSGFEAEVDLNQGSLCYFDGLTNLEGRHGTRPLCSDGSAHLEEKYEGRLVLVIRGRTNRNYRTYFNKIYSVGRGVSGWWDLLCRWWGSGNGGSVPGWKVNHLDKGDRKQAEKQKERGEEEGEAVLDAKPQDAPPRLDQRMFLLA
jgi:hypothetical protein